MGGDALSEGTEPSEPARSGGPPVLRADCERCFGLCCVARPFSASADFALDKPAGQPCPHLQPDFRCGIHRELRRQGFPGCAVYDCFGAGQQVSQVTFGGRDWRQAPQAAKQMFEVFPVLTAAARAALVSRRGAGHAGGPRRPPRTAPDPEGDAGLDAQPGRRPAGTGYRQAPTRGQCSAARRERAHAGPGPGAKAGRAGSRPHRRPPEERRPARRQPQRGRPIGADLRGADLLLADLTGADLRGADLRGADLTQALFLTQAQLEAATGDADPVPASLARPASW